MRALTDTHTIVWALSSPERLGPKARRVLAKAEVVASVASLWELILKAGRNQPLLSRPVPWWEKYVIQAGVPVLAIRTSHVIALDRLPQIHRDPFDRILVAQAIVEGAVLVTKDSSLASYGVPVIW